MVLFLREAVQKTVKERWKVSDGTLENGEGAKWCRRKLKVARWYETVLYCRMQMQKGDGVPYGTKWYFVGGCRCKLVSESVG